MNKKLLALKIKESNLREAIGGMELGSPEFDYYNQVWKNLPEAKRLEIRERWRKYFRDIANTEVGLKLRIKVARMKGKDTTELEKIKPIKDLQKPEGIEPDVMMNEMEKYWGWCKSLERIEREIKEFGGDSL